MYVISKYMTKKLKAFRTRFARAKRRESGSFFRAKPEKMNHISPFSHERSEQKGGDAFFVMSLEVDYSFYLIQTFN